MQDVHLSGPGQSATIIPIPSEWNELTVAEMELVATTLLATPELLIEAKIFLLLRMIEGRAVSPLAKNWRERLAGEDVATQGLEAIAFLFNENNRTKNPYPFLKFDKRRFRGPADDFGTILCGEMEDCEICFHKMSEDGTLEHCARLAAILWRPRNTKYDSRISAQRFQMFCKLPAPVLLSIFTWYNGCRNQLPLHFPDVYGGGEGPSAGPDHLAFTKCIHAGAGPKNGTRENIRQMPAMEFLFDMQMEAEQIKKMEQDYGK